MRDIDPRMRVSPLCIALGRGSGLTHVGGSRKSSVHSSLNPLGEILHRRSDVGFAGSQQGFGFEQANAFQGGKIRAHGAGWIAQGGPVAANRCQHGFGVDFEEVGDKGAGVLCREGVGSQAASRKVPQVGGHNHIRLPADRGRQHMAVVGVGQVEFGSEGFVSGYEGVGNVPAQDRAGPVQHVSVDVGPISQKVANPIRMDVSARQWGKEVSVCETQQEVAKAGRIENVGVK